jgi:hypothetical protein
LDSTETTECITNLPILFKIHFNLTTQYTPTFPNWSNYFRFSDQHSACISHLPLCTHSAHLIFNLFRLKTSTEEYKLCNSLQPFVIISVTTQYFPPRFVITHPQSMFFPSSGRPSSASVYNRYNTDTDFHNLSYTAALTLPSVFRRTGCITYFTTLEEGRQQAG